MTYAFPTSIDSYEPEYVSSDGSTPQMFLPLVFVMIGMGILLMGQFYPDDRMFVLGVPLNPVLYSLAAILAHFARFEYTSRTIGLLVLLVVAVPSIAWSYDPGYGTYKLANLIASTYLAVVFFGEAIYLGGLLRFTRLVVTVLSAIAIIAILYKLRFGFFSRQVTFFLFGPIVFGRLMSIGMIFAWFSFRGKTRLAAVIFFGILMTWTQSKGPVLASGICFTAIAITQLRSPKVALLLIGSVLLVGLFVQFRDYFRHTPVLDRYVLALDIHDARNRGSIDVRLEYWRNASTLILSNPIQGVGVGGWAGASGQSEKGIGYAFRGYPHNFVLEVLCELGIFAGAIFLIPYLFWLRSGLSALSVSAAVMLVAAQFSGDMLDTRYILVFSLLSYLVYKDAEYDGEEYGDQGYEDEIFSHHHEDESMTDHHRGIAGEH